MAALDAFKASEAEGFEDALDSVAKEPPKKGRCKYL